MHISPLDYVLWFSIIALELWLLVATFRHLRVQFPIFTAYLAYKVLRNLLMLSVVIKHDYGLYFYSFWVFTFIADALAIFCCYELATRLHCNWRMTSVSIAFFFVVSVLLSTFGQSHYYNPMMGFIWDTERSVGVFICGMFILLGTFCDGWSLHRRSIAAGLVMYYALKLISFSLVAHQRIAALENLPTLAYLGSLACWLVYLRKPDLSPAVINGVQASAIRKAVRSCRQSSNISQLTG